VPGNFKISEEFLRTERESVEDFRSETRAGPGLRLVAQAMKSLNGC